jgi:hypothetical protein
MRLTRKLAGSVSPRRASRSKAFEMAIRAALGSFFRGTDQTACTTRCRHRKYEQSEAFKAMRRKYMREYHALKKSGKVK